MKTKLEKTLEREPKKELTPLEKFRLRYGEDYKNILDGEKVPLYKMVFYSPTNMYDRDV